HALFFDSDDAIDAHAGAGSRGIGATARVGNRFLERLALSGTPIFEIESDAADRRRSRSDRGVEHLAGAGDIVDANLDRVSRQIFAKRLPAVDVVELRLQIVARSANRVGGKPHRLE